VVKERRKTYLTSSGREGDCLPDWILTSLQEVKQRRTNIPDLFR
jgi:hypothetical protein